MCDHRTVSANIPWMEAEPTSLQVDTCFTQCTCSPVRPKCPFGRCADQFCDKCIHELTDTEAETMVSRFGVRNPDPGLSEDPDCPEDVLVRSVGEQLQTYLAKVCTMAHVIAIGRLGDADGSVSDWSRCHQFTSTCARVFALMRYLRSVFPIHRSHQLDSVHIAQHFR